MSRGIILLAAGGTGGHMYPASALAGKLKAAGYDVHLAADQRGLAYVATLEPMAVHKITAATIYGAGMKAILRRGLILLYSFLQGLMLVLRLRPVVIVGFGGYPSFPPVLVGLLLRRKVLVHEQNAVLGRANHMAASLGANLAVSVGDTLNVPKSAGRRARNTGNPLRPEVLQAAEGSYRLIAPNRPIDLLIFGGSQGADVFDHVISAAINLLDDDLKRRLRVVQQTRPSAMAQLLKEYTDMGVYAELRDFFDDLPNRIRRAHLTICRGGASSVAEIVALGAPAIFVPLPGALDQDQAHNVRAIERDGGCIVLPQSSLSEAVLAARLTELFHDKSSLQNISSRALTFAAPKAAERLARYVLCLAEKRPIDINRPFERSETTGASQ